VQDSTTSATAGWENAGRAPRCPQGSRSGPGHCRLHIKDRTPGFICPPHPHPRTEGQSDKRHQRLRPQTPELRWEGRVCSSHFRMLVTSSYSPGWDTAHKLTMSGFCSDLSSATILVPRTGHSSRETESHRVALSSTACSRKWRSQEGISCVKQSVLLGWPLIGQFLQIPPSSTSHWLVIQDAATAG
jgi:hypothetical protein